MRIALSQLNLHIGNFGFNTREILRVMEQAGKQNADILVLPELAVCGYPPRDFLEFDEFIGRCSEAVQTIALQTGRMAVILGAPAPNPGPGKRLFNSAYFLCGGKIMHIRHKSLLPNYDIFDEYRYFEPNREFSLIEFRGQKIGLTICEDIWNIGSDPLYPVNPLDELSRLGPDMIINIAASPFNTRQHEARLEVLRNAALKSGAPVIYVNHCGAQTELIFDGGSMLMAKDGTEHTRLPYFEAGICIVDTDKRAGTAPPPVPSVTERIHDALVCGIRDYFVKMGFSKAIIGLSGGIDSAVTLALASEALGAENVLAILLPSRFSSDHSVNDARKLAENLRCPYHIIPINDACNSVEKSLNPLFGEHSPGITEENIQARVRAVLLMGISNKLGHILLNTSNKSEAAVGYGTLYGDMCGGLSVLGDVYKTQVYDLAGFINRSQEVIPQNTILKAPSAELRPDQKDSDSLPEYGILDRLLYQYIEERNGPGELAAQGFDPDLVERVLSMVNSNEYKRHQAPPILRVSSKAFGAGRRMPIVGKYLS